MSTSPLNAHPIPQVPGYPLLGALPYMRDPLTFFARVGLMFPEGLAYLPLGRRKVLLVWHPDFVQAILETRAESVYQRGESMEPVRVFLGESIVTTDGPVWRRKRRLLQPVFRRERIARWTPLMLDVTALSLRRWRPQDPIGTLARWVPPMAEAAAQALTHWETWVREGRLVDIHQEMIHLTLAILLRTAFSLSVDARTTETLHQAFATIQQFLQTWVWSPLRLPLWIPLPAHRRFREALRRVRAAVQHVIQERRASEERHDDLLDQLLHAQDPETGHPLEDREIQDEVLAFFFAGHETTAVTLSWMWYLLSMHPHVQERMREEMFDLLGERPITFEDVYRLTYSRMVFEETLRLYPPAWILSRTAMQEDRLGDFPIPAGTHILVAAYITHRHPNWWTNPLGFDPERFRPEHSQGRPRYAHFPFGGGPHTCIGATFALVEAMVILSTVIRKYRLELVPGFPVHPKPMLTIHPWPGVMMRVRPL